MSNRAYLTTSDFDRIYPGFKNPAFENDENIALSSAGCIPLLWLALFSDTDLVSTTFKDQGEEIPAFAPLTERTTGIARLKERTPFLNRMFEKNGGLDHHIGLFSKYLKSCPGHYLSLQCDEIACLYGDDEFNLLLEKALRGLQKADEKAKKPLVALSTLLPKRQFITLADAQAGKYEDEDMWNYFRIMGETHSRKTLWE